jgi:hypothetical protein
VIGFLKQLFGLFQAVGRLWADRQLLEAGKATQREADLKEVLEREQKAEQAVAVADADRTERLRSRFDRSRRSQ